MPPHASSPPRRRWWRRWTTRADEGAVSLRRPAEDALVESADRHLRAQGAAPGRSHAGAACGGHEPADRGAEPRRLSEGHRDHARRRSAPHRRTRGRRGGAPPGGGRVVFGEDEYYLAFLGTPSTTRAVDAAVRRPSPRDQPDDGRQPGDAWRRACRRRSRRPTPSRAARSVRSATENDKAFALINALDATQRSQAILGLRAWPISCSAPARTGRTIQPEGIRASALSRAQQAMLLDIVREWAGIVTDAFAAPRMAEIRARLAADLVRVERPDDERQRRVLPDPGADAGDRVRAAAQRRSHPHDLPRSDQRLRREVCAQVAIASSAAGSSPRAGTPRVGAPARRVSAGGAHRHRSGPRPDRAGPDAGHRGGAGRSSRRSIAITTALSSRRKPAPTRRG